MLFQVLSHLADILTHSLPVVARVQIYRLFKIIRMTDWITTLTAILINLSGIISYTSQYKAEATAAHATGKHYFLGETNSGGVFLFLRCFCLSSKPQKLHVGVVASALLSERLFG